MSIGITTHDAVAHLLACFTPEDYAAYAVLTFEEFTDGIPVLRHMEEAFLADDDTAWRTAVGAHIPVMQRLRDALHPACTATDDAPLSAMCAVCLSHAVPMFAVFLYCTVRLYDHPSAAARNDAIARAYAELVEAERLLREKQDRQEVCR